MILCSPFMEAPPVNETYFHTHIYETLCKLVWLTGGEAWFAGGVLRGQAQGFLRQGEGGGGWGGLRARQGAMDT